MHFSQAHTNEAIQIARKVSTEKQAFNQAFLKHQLKQIEQHVNKNVGKEQAG